MNEIFREIEMEISRQKKSCYKEARSRKYQSKNATQGTVEIIFMIYKRSRVYNYKNECLLGQYNIGLLIIIQGIFT